MLKTVSSASRVRIVPGRVRHLQQRRSATNWNQWTRRMEFLGNHFPEQKATMLKLIHDTAQLTAKQEEYVRNAPSSVPTVDWDAWGKRIVNQDFFNAYRGFIATWPKLDLNKHAYFEVDAETQKTVPQALGDAQQAVKLIEQNRSTVSAEIEKLIAQKSALQWTTLQDWAHDNPEEFAQIDKEHSDELRGLNGM